ncbi:sodium/myo-inositol cotransporter-like [Haliotis cracherodii]|uniref:sodium/myo-inositol cotransporter-like n=1 Tax=Haliotis cracherodii TaxID=6455 RepID=UPI0039E97631
MAYNSESRLTSADIGVVVGYFVLVVGVGVFAMCRAKRNSVSGYFLAGRSMWFVPIGASLFVSNIGTEHFIGLAGSGAGNGISVGAWELNALMLLQLLGWIFVPVYIACGTYTMPEYLSKRFGGTRMRVYFAFLSLILYIFTKCSGDLFTGALFIQQSLKWDLYLSIVLLVLVTAVLTITGGLTAVIYTDTLQAVLMLTGALYLTGAGFYEIGGFTGLLEKYPQAVPKNASSIVPGTTCHHPDKQAFRMLREVDDDYMPWLGFLLGQTPGSIWYWCADQVIVQRALAAKSVSHAQGATLMAGFIKILPIFIMVMPGMMSRILYPDEVACTNPDYCMEVCQSKAGCTNIAFPRLVLGLMPDGARGLMMAVMVAALMSDLDSIFNSASTLFTIDIWKRFRQRASVTELMIVGRVFIVVMVGVSIAWVPVIKESQGGQVFIYIQEITNYLAPPFAAVFLLGVLVPRVNEKGAFWALMVAFVTGMVRLFVVMVYQFDGETYCGAKNTGYQLPGIVKNFHYMYFSLFITLLTAVLAIVISLFTEKPEEKYLIRTTYWTRHDPRRPDVLDIELSRGHGIKAGVDNPAVEMNDVDVKVADGEVVKKVFRSPEVTEESAEQPPGVGRRVFNYLCGVGSIDEDEGKAKEMMDHLEDIASLQQSKCVKIVLTVGLCIIMGIGVAMYIFWSLYKFDTPPFYPEGAASLLPGDYNSSMTAMNTTV